MASDLADIAEGLARLLAQARIGVYRTDSPYTADETGIFIASMPDAPDRAICLAPYPIEDTDLTDSITAVQIRIRAGVDPFDALATSDQTRDLLHNRRRFYLGAVSVALCWRQSQASLGADVHGRQELAANYYLRTSSSAPNLYE